MNVLSTRAILPPLLTKKSPTHKKAVYQESYTAALKVNRRIQEKGFPVLEHCGKSEESGSFLRENTSYVNTVREPHPELCFVRLSEGFLISKHEN
ncbi:DUF429 domain-containing protein [Thermotoga sp.]|uniref:DUF429 domain-containing protein n=1 Tax=Thermotoga sp. TaxID=28240 RepID=UPI003457C35D